MNKPDIYDLKKEIGQVFKYLRLKHEYTQRDVMLKADVFSAAHVEMGNVGLDMVNELSFFYDMTPSQILDQAEKRLNFENTYVRKGSEIRITSLSELQKEKGLFIDDFFIVYDVINPLTNEIQITKGNRNNPAILLSESNYKVLTY